VIRERSFTALLIVVAQTPFFRLLHVVRLLYVERGRRLLVALFEHIKLVLANLRFFAKDRASISGNFRVGTAGRAVSVLSTLLRLKLRRDYFYSRVK
jgi:hypothetical protein